MAKKLVSTNGTAGIGHNVGTRPTFTPEQEAILRAGLDVLADVTKHEREFIARRTYDYWKPIARALQVLRDVAKAASKVAGRKRLSFRELRELCGYGDDVLKKDRVSRLLKVIDNEAAIEAWRASLTEEQRRDWSSAEAIVKHCPDIPRKSKPESAVYKRVPLREVLANAMKKIEGLEAHVAELEAALELARSEAVEKSPAAVDPRGEITERRT
jgi:hypothetical protein